MTRKQVTRGPQFINGPKDGDSIPFDGIPALPNHDMLYVGKAQDDRDNFL